MRNRIRCSMQTVAIITVIIIYVVIIGPARYHESTVWGLREYLTGTMVVYCRYHALVEKQRIYMVAF